MQHHSHLSRLEHLGIHAMETDRNNPDPLKKSTDDDPNSLALFASPRRINRLATALGLDRYLEIGVETGLTFLQVNCKQKNRR
jgi:hypothetical protein